MNDLASELLAIALLSCDLVGWFCLIGGLAVRYLLKRPRLGHALLVGSPMADLILLGLTVLDLRHGAVASQLHAFAAVYVGFSLIFGPRIVTWLDGKFTQGSVRRRSVTPLSARHRLHHEMRDFMRASATWAISSLLLVVLATQAQRASDVRMLLINIAILTAVLALWFLMGPVPAAVRVATQSVHSIRYAKSGVAMKPSQSNAEPSRWAPWWVYLILILGLNYLRQLIMPVGSMPEWTVALVVIAGSATLFALITAAHRLRQRSVRH